MRTEDGGEDVDFTQRETFGWLDVALSFLVALAAAVLTVAMVTINWPLFLAAVK